MSGLFQEVMFQLGVKQFKFSAYHPQSQGALERFHQTLKSMIRAYCFQEKRLGPGDTSLTFCGTGSCTDLSGI